MSYPPYGGPPHGYQQPPPSRYPPQGYPPQQQGYGGPPQGYPPPGQYLPQQHQGYPPQHQGYPPQQPQSYPTQQHQGYPQQQQQAYPPHQAPFGVSSHSPFPQQQPYPAPPSQYGAPPPGQYGAPQRQQLPYSGGPPQAAYGPPPQPYGAPAAIPTPPSPGYGLNDAVQYDATPRASELYRAMKGIGTNEAALIRTLANIPAIEIPCLISTYKDKYKRDLIEHIKKETSGHFEECLVFILRGPLENDIGSIDYGLRGFALGMGTKEMWLNDVLIGRSNADIHAIKRAYQKQHKRSVEDAISGDLSLKTKSLFQMILAGTRQEDSAPVLPESVRADVDTLIRAIHSPGTTEQLSVCSILSNRSDGQIRAIAHEYNRRAYKKEGRDLETVISRKFAGHMEDVLVDMLRCGCDRAMRDAQRLEECMAGGGTKDKRLVAVVTALHWDRQHMAQVKGAYRSRYGKELARRIKGDTSGDYEDCLLAMIG